MSRFKKVQLICAAICMSFASVSMAAGDAVAGKTKSAPCQACHGPDGNSPAPQFPKIAGQYADYLEHALNQYKSGERTDAIMAGMVVALTAEDIEDLAAWFSSQKGLHDTVK